MAASNRVRDFILGPPQTAEVCPFLPLLRALEAGDHALEGRVYRDSHYVHENSTSVSVDCTLPERYDAWVSRFVKFLENKHRAWNRELTEELYKELEYQTSDAAVEEALDGAEMHFDDETGEAVDLTDYVAMTELPPKIQARVCQEYADLFGVSPETAQERLVQRGVRFDAQGRRVDVSRFKRVGELPADVKAQVLEEYRDWNTQDSFWAEPLLDAWKRRLEALGYRRVDISYALGYSQGSGASFTADYFDGKELLRALLFPAQKA